MNTSISMLTSGIGSFMITVRSSVMSGIGDGMRVGFTPWGIRPKVRSSSGMILSAVKSPQSTSPIFCPT